MTTHHCTRSLRLIHAVPCAVLVLGVALTTPMNEVRAQEGSGSTLLDEAISAVEAADTRVVDPDVLFNAGLGFARHGELGASVLWLERAQLAAPLDREIFDTRQRVQESARREHASANGSFHFGEPPELSWWRTFRAVPAVVAQVLAILGAWLVGGIGARFALRGRPEPGSTQATTQWAGILIGAVLWLSGTIYWAGREIFTSGLEPVVLMQERPSYREAPDELATTRRHADMYAGAVVLQLEKRDGWLRVKLAGGDTVWVSEEHVAPIDYQP